MKYIPPTLSPSGGNEEQEEHDRHDPFEWCPGCALGAAGHGVTETAESRPPTPVEVRHLDECDHGEDHRDERGEGQGEVTDAQAAHDADDV